MDVCALGRFHGSVTRLVPDFSVPPGGLQKFLRYDLREKVFLVSLGVLEDRWATRVVPSLSQEQLGNIRVCMRILVEHVYHSARLRQNELRTLFSRFNVPSEATWMFYIIMVLLRSVGFDGDDGPGERGFGPLDLAVSETEFLFRKCSECFLLRASMNDEALLEYPDYDPHQIVADFFAKRRPLHSFERIPVKDPPPVSFEVKENLNFWCDAGRVVEGTLIALSRMKSHVLVETNEEGKVIHVDRGSVDAIMSEMVHQTPAHVDNTDVQQGIRTYASSGTRLEFTSCIPGADGITFWEEWVPELILGSA